MSRTRHILATFIALLYAASACAKPGTLVSAGGDRKLNIRCLGTGSPTVILTAGAGDDSLVWHSLQKQLAQRTRVCAWDRAGFGFSDPSPDVQDTRHTTQDLEALLAAPGNPPPYLLVGHSLGSYESLMFAFRHPQQVMGLVLIDPAAPHQFLRLQHAAPDTYAVIDAYQREQLVEMRDKGNQLSLLEEAYSDRDSNQLDASKTTLGAIPLIVLTAGAPPPIPLKGAAASQMPQLQAEWSKMHDELAALSTRGVNRTVPGATHYIYRDRPTVVLKAIREVLAPRKV